MSDKRDEDRRKSRSTPEDDKRKGPRRLTCDCGGKIEVHSISEKFKCARCGKEY